MRGLKSFARGLLPFVVLVLAWTAVTRAGLVAEIFLPRPEEVLRTGWEMARDGSLWTNIVASLGRVGLGLVVSVPLAVGAGVAVGLSRRLAAVLEPVAGFFNSLSGIAWLPLAVTWFGLGFLIFNAQNFHQTDTILVGIITIGLIWLATDRLLLQPLERWTVERWGMVSTA